LVVDQDRPLSASFVDAHQMDLADGVAAAASR